jgi:electron transport complex protein RnfG
MKKKSLWLEIRFMIILSFICASLLGGTQILLGERAELSDNTIKSVFSILGEKSDTKNNYELFNSTFKQLSKGRTKIWLYNKSDSIYACEATGSGMWSEITVVFVFDTKKQLIMGLRVIEQKETAGLGSKISEDDFLGQFHNLDVNREVKVDAISGATMSSNAVQQILTKAIYKINKYVIIQ